MGICISAPQEPAVGNSERPTAVIATPVYVTSTPVYVTSAYPVMPVPVVAATVVDASAPPTYEPVDAPIKTLAPIPSITLKTVERKVEGKDEGKTAQSRRAREPIMLLDSTGSMTWPASDADEKKMSSNQPWVSRWSVVREAVGLLVDTLGAHDDQAGKATDDGEEDKGGVRTITFAGGSAMDCGDWRVDNLDEEFAKVTARLGGHTEIVPGWLLVETVFGQEFNKLDDKPVKVVLTITDGNAADFKRFSELLAAEPENDLQVQVALVGFGDETQKAFDNYSALAVRHKNMHIAPMSACTNPKQICASLLKGLDSAD